MSETETTTKVRKYLPPVHTSFETAFEQDGYPYGRRGRCLRRVWLEFSASHGYRFVYRTSKPYYPENGQTAETVRNQRWNAPHASTYSALEVLYLDENDHIHGDAVSAHATPEQFAAFRERAKDGLGEAGLKRLELIEKATAAFAKAYAARQAAQEAQPILTASQVVDRMIANLDA